MKCIIVAAMTLLVTMPARAQEPQGERPSPQDGTWSLRWRDHPAIDWSGKLHVEFRARLQGDRRASRAAIETAGGDGFDVGRRRIGLQGGIGSVVEFQVERELEKNDPWRDVFVNYRGRKSAQIQIGQFKLPFGLEETTSGARLDFIYRSLVSMRLAPGRDAGVMLHGQLIDRRLEYEVGSFAHDGDNARPNGGSRVFGGRTTAGRVTLEPFRRSKSALSDVQVGVAFTHSSLPEGFPAIRGRSVLGVSFFDADQWVRGHRRRAGVQVRWRPGRFSVASEYLRVSDDRRGQDRNGGNLTPLLARGWYVDGTWVAAGASSSTHAPEPRRPLFQGGFGSIQLAVRLEQLGFGSASGTSPPSASPRAESVLGNRETAITFGASWHPNRWITARGNLIREQIGEPTRNSPPGLRFWTRLFRIQLAI